MVGDPKETTDVEGRQFAVDAESVETEDLSTVYSVRISSASGLDNLDSHLSQGDVVGVEQPETPYRTSSWIDINTQDVTIVFEGARAKDGQAIVKPADGADVGGIRVGTGATTITDVTIKNFGFDGNQATMTDTVKRLHGLIVDNATEVRIEGGFYTQTHPYQEHNSGGSGISVHDAASHVTIRDVLIDDIGDRGVQVGGTNILVESCHIKNGYDRSISFDVQQPDGTFYAASESAAVGNICRDNSDGSCIGLKSPTSQTYENITIADNVLRGQMRAGVRIASNTNSNADSIVVAGNTVTSGDGSGTDAALYAEGGNDILFVGNTVKDEGSGWGQLIALSHNGYAIGNQLVCNGTDGIILRGNNAAAIGNIVLEFGSAGTGSAIESESGNNHAIMDNFFRTSNSAADLIKGTSGGPYYLKGNILSHAAGGTNPTDFYDLDTEPEIAESNWPVYYQLDTIVTVSGGGSTTQTIPGTSLGDDVEVAATPANDPSNDHGYTVDKTWWDDSAGAIKVQVSETEAAGGGDVRIAAKKTTAL